MPKVFNYNLEPIHINEILNPRTKEGPSTEQTVFPMKDFWETKEDLLDEFLEFVKKHSLECSVLEFEKKYVGVVKKY